MAGGQCEKSEQPVNGSERVQSRGLSPVVAVVLLVFLTAVLSVSVGLAVTTTPSESPPNVRLSLAVDAQDQAIALTHEGGDVLSVGELSIRVEVDGTPLDEQPPVPFFAAHGFASGPEGPFNTESDDSWRAGETAAFALASTNDPTISEGSTVQVTVTAGGSVIFEEEMVAR